MFDLPTTFLVRCLNPIFKSDLVSTCRKLYHGKSDQEDPHIYYIIYNNINYQLNINTDESIAPDRSCPVIEITDEENFSNDNQDKDRLLLHFCISSIIKPAKCEKNTYTVYHKSISMASVHSTFTYFFMLNECYPYQLHIQSFPLNEDCLVLLKRLFRSLDNKFINRISLQDLSDLNQEIFGVSFSSDDYSSIFQILHEGAEPVFVDTVKTMTITFDEFLKIMQQMHTLGFGHVIYKYMFSLKYHLYLNPFNLYEFEGKPSELNTAAKKFIQLLYRDFPDQPTKSQLIELFEPNGGAPQRLRNLITVEEEEWLDMWYNWFKNEPKEVARHLFAFGYPLDMIDQAFIVEQEPAVVPIAATVAGITAAAAICGSALFFLRMKRR